MKICIVGSGYVGLVSGACFSEYGYDVTCIDVDAEKIDRLKQGMIPIYEPGLDDLVERNLAAHRLKFTTDLGSTVADSDVIFIAVGTPGRHDDGRADLTFLWAAVDEIAENLRPGSVVVTKSTVVVGTTAKIGQVIAAKRPGLEFSIAANPEFLREGSALEDFMRPYRIIVGVNDVRGREALAKVYRPLSLRDAPVMFTSLEDAELIKYATNAYLAMKISFINEIADLCERVGGNVQEVAKGIGLDGRIGGKFLHPGPGYGGSCFPKDTRALAATGQEHGAPIELIEKVIAINEERKAAMADRIIGMVGDTAGKTVAILGVSYKPNTDDIRDAPSLTIIPRLQAAGMTVRATDPEAMANARQVLPGVVWCDNEYDAVENADILVILTEWNAYRGLDLDIVREKMRTPVIADLRNIYRIDEMAGKGFKYASIGRRPVDG